MNLSKIEKIVYVGCPWFFGAIMSICGGLISFFRPQSLKGVVLSAAGLICISLYCICALLVKLIDRK